MERLRMEQLKKTWRHSKILGSLPQTLTTLQQAQLHSPKLGLQPLSCTPISFSSVCLQCKSYATDAWPFEPGSMLNAWERKCIRSCVWECRLQASLMGASHMPSLARLYTGLFDHSHQVWASSLACKNEQSTPATTAWSRLFGQVSNHPPH